MEIKDADAPTRGVTRRHDPMIKLGEYRATVSAQIKDQRGDIERLRVDTISHSAHGGIPGDDLRDASGGRAGEE
jgi:hypothetical protein